MKRSTNVERDTIERFRDRYERRGSAAERAVERAGVGANVGVNGYTTVQQAAQMGRLLRLRRGTRLLDMGCGSGYPALYLARTTGCEVVASDMPIASLRTGMARAARERTARRAAFVAATALHLPFRRESFDAISHTDVLC